MARLVLHVGTHKTASTSIQKSFFANRELLAKHGLIYPNIGRTDGHHGLVTDWINLAPVYHLPGGSVAAWKKMARETAEGDHTVFLSSEEFSRGHPQARMDLKEIRSWLGSYDEIKVICVLRDQVSFLQSVYLEISKNQAPPQWNMFFQNTLRNGYGAGLFLNYADLDDHLRSAFAEDEIHYVDYATASGGDGIRAHMLALAGCDLDSGELQGSANVSSANVSPDPLASWVASMIARPNAADPALMTLVRNTLRADLGEDRKTTLYVRSEIDRLRKLITPWNDALHERLATRQPDFVLSDPGLPEDIAFRNHLKTSFWVNLTQSIFNGDGK